MPDDGTVRGVWEGSMKPALRECRHCHGQGVGPGGRCINCGGKGVVRPKTYVCPTAFNRYWREMSQEERAHVCGDNSGPLVKGVGTVCTLHKEHAGSHYDSVAGLEWSGTFCSACQGHGRVTQQAPVDHPGRRESREDTCRVCNGTGRLAA